MRNLSKLAILVGMSLSASAIAQSITGIVTTADGNPVTQAKVVVEGTGKRVFTDSNGRFSVQGLTVGMNEIHVSASGFAHLHKDVQVPDAGAINLSLVLQQSPIEVIDVVSTPLHLSAMESSIPVSVLAGENLQRQQRATLGDTLEKVVGVHTNFHAKVASTPVIRGLSGPRVLIAQNGLDVSDVSRVGPDHAVASEASTATQIEVLRGPATLFYGSGAIGGVVNVVDSRVPTDSETRGEWLLEKGSVDNQKLASFNFTTGTDNFAFYADGFWRDSDDYEVPVEPEMEEKKHKKHKHKGDYSVENSAEESRGFTLGASYLYDNGHIGIAVEKFNREYGIPGHSHGEGEHKGHDHGHGHGEGAEAHAEEVFADMQQTRVQMLGEFRLQNPFISQINLRAGVTDYEHAEIEHGKVGTLFSNETRELRLDALHTPLNDWRGGLSFHYKGSEVAAQGSEAFTPPSEAKMIALALMEEKHFGDVLLQLGGRIERSTLQADRVLLPKLEAHTHDEDNGNGHGHDGHDHGHGGHDHGHGHGSEDQVTRVFSADHTFTPVSLSAGAVWEFTSGYNVGVAVSRAERAPSASELLSFGPHIGTRTYEIGALFSLKKHDGETEIGLTDKTIDLETSNNIDLTLRKNHGDVGFIVNAFYNSVDNYYYQEATGLFADDGHDHGSHDHGHGHGHNHGHDGEENHEGELPVFLFKTDDVILHGFEAQVAWQVSSEFKSTFFADYVRARLKDGGNLPRTSPMRFGAQFSYQTERLSLNLDITRYQTQDRNAKFETATGGYTMVDANVSYDLPIFNDNIAVYLKGDNLTDTEARVHTSFLKDIAPRAGRNVSIGIKGYF